VLGNGIGSGLSSTGQTMKDDKKQKDIARGKTWITLMAAIRLIREGPGDSRLT